MCGYGCSILFPDVACGILLKLEIFSGSIDMGKFYVDHTLSVGE